MNIFNKAGRWIPCSIDMFINISGVEAALIASLNDDYEYAALFILMYRLIHLRPDDGDEILLEKWSKILTICPSLQDLFGKATTQRGQDRFVEALDMVRGRFTISFPANPRTRLQKELANLESIILVLSAIRSLIGFPEKTILSLT